VKKIRILKEEWFPGPYKLEHQPGETGTGEVKVRERDLGSPRLKRRGSSLVEFRLTDLVFSLSIGRLGKTRELLKKKVKREGERAKQH